MTFSEARRAYVEKARVGRLATADARGQPNVAPFRFALVDEALVPAVDGYWSQLAWVQARGRAELVESGGDGNPGSAQRVVRLGIGRRD
jgi:nitroimidazol reductase NimA-like FMN-containing flavoprotein (pyridoxamine 5'-phosphate oxidase superfamily)